MRKFSRVYVFLSNIFSSVTRLDWAGAGDRDESLSSSDLPSSFHLSEDLPELDYCQDGTTNNKYLDENNEVCCGDMHSGREDSSCRSGKSEESSSSRSLSDKTVSKLVEHYEAMNGEE